MFWNYHGAGNKDFVSVCKHYIREHHPSIFIIMETRIDPSLLRKKSFLGFDGNLFYENQGHAGGIAMGWNSDIMQITLLQKHFQFLHVSIKSGDEASWNLTVIYVSLMSDGKKALRQELTELVAKVDIG